MKFDSLMLMNMPLSVKGGAIDIEGAAKNAKVINTFWDPTDQVVHKRNGVPLASGPWNHEIEGLKEISERNKASKGFAKIQQFNIMGAKGASSGNHANTLNKEDARDRYAQHLSNGVKGNYEKTRAIVQMLIRSIEARGFEKHKKTHELQHIVDAQQRNIPRDRIDNEYRLSVLTGFELRLFNKIK